MIAIDHVDYRLAHAKRTNHVETYNFEKIPEMESYIREITKGGADVVIDCVGLDAKRTPAEMLGKDAEVAGRLLGCFPHGCVYGSQIRDHPANRRIRACL